MSRRQTIPSRWLIIPRPVGASAVADAARLPRGTGLLLLEPAPAGAMRRLERVARRRGLTLLIESDRAAARVHNMRELRRALLAGTPLILLSPLYPTSSHPEWKPIPRMRAAAMARLAGRALVALGGMDDGRYAKIAQLGFTGWAGISGFRT